MTSKLSRQIEELLAALAPDSVVLSTAGQAFITLPHGSQTFPLHDSIVRDWLTDRYVRLHGTPPLDAALRQTIDTLRARASCLPARARVALRLADGAPQQSLLIDLANELGEAVELSPSGWRIHRFATGVVFQSARGQLSLPHPEHRELAVAPVSALLDPAIQDWALAALRPHGPYPILILHGPPGSGKTTLARMLRGLLDPVTAPIMGLPSRGRAIEQLACRNRVLAFDHVTHMSNSAAGALCRIASGIGIEVHERGDRRDPLTLDIARPIILTTPRQGLADWQPRPDLASRAIAVHLARIDNVRPQQELLSEFDAVRPALLADLYSSLATQWNNKPPDCPPCDLTHASAAADPLFEPIRSLAVERGEWSGTAGDLLNEICVSLTPGALSHRLRRLAPALAGRDIQVEYRRRIITLRHGIDGSLPTTETEPAPPARNQPPAGPHPRPACLAAPRGKVGISTKRPHVKITRLIAASALAAALVAATFAQTKLQQAQDEDYARLVKQWTTKPEFMSPLVDHLPKANGIPSPKDVLGYYIGTPKKLTHVADINRYYRALAAASPRVKVFEAGLTDEGRECIVVAVSAEDTIRNLDSYKGYLARLADPRGLSAAQAKEIIAQAKPIYMFTGGLHSAETGPPEMLMELAYRLAADESPLYDQIRRNVIVMIGAVAEPDGRDRYVDWYNRYKIAEETERDRVPGPPYWGKYILHDNNRDINYSQITMRNWLKFYLEWHPPIMHDLHESVPFMYTFSGQAPQNPTLDPILYGELPWFSNFEMTKMIRYGMPGVWTHGFVDMWSPGYLGFMSSNHNGMLRMYETFGNGGANTMKRNVAAPEGGGGPNGPSQTSREWYRPLPPYKEVVWSMRNNTNYMETGVLSALELTSGFSKTILENFYEKSRNSIESGTAEAPFGYVLPAGQPDMTRVAFIVNILRLQGIEVGRATAEVKLKDGSFPAGSLIVKRNQPYGRLAKILLEKQKYPDNNLRTYDDTAWTMGLMSHAAVEEISDRAVLDVPVAPVDTLEIDGTVKGSGPMLAVLDNGANSLVTLRYRLKNAKFEALEQSAKSAGADLPAGSFLVASTPEARAQIVKLGLNAVALPNQPAAPKHNVDLPRLAVYSTWGATQDVGWVRYAFDHFEVPYDLIYKERVRQGHLRDSYDVIVIPNQGRGSAKSLVFDLESKGKPLAYARTPEYKSLGEYGESPDITGGMGIAGVEEFDRFVNEGGVLITLGAASFFPADFGIARDVDAARTTPQFYAPGPIVEAEILKPTHPIFYGYTKKTVPVRYANGPLLRVPQEDRKWILMRFPGTDSSVLSGLMKGVAETRNRPAVLDVPVGSGRVILFATNPCYRWQNLGEFNMLANAILHYNDFPKPAAPSDERPTTNEDRAAR